MRRYRRVALGGTFDRLHVGHRSLLAAAFRSGRRVSIGLTTDSYLARHPKPGRLRLQPYSARRRALRRFLRAHYPGRAWEVVRLDDRFGRSVEPWIDALVVTAETTAGGRAVNAERRRRGLPELPLITVPLALAQDRRPVSSSRIRDGTIDRAGRLCRSIRVGVRAEDRQDLGPLRDAVRGAFLRVRILGAWVPPSRGPAATRARRLAADALRSTQFAIGVARTEAGDRVVSIAARGLALGLNRVTASGAAPLRRAVADRLAPPHPELI